MKKLNILILATTFLPFNALALSCISTTPKCVDYGYKYSSCPGESMACPFDTSFKQCDREALNNDFKFSLNTGYYWTSMNNSSSYKGSFVVGANGTQYCQIGLEGKLESRIQQHRHLVRQINTAKSATKRTSIYNHNYGAETTNTTTYYADSTSTQASYSDSSLIAELISDEFRPQNMAVDGGTYNYTDSIKTTLQKSLPSTKPSCATMGYKNKASDCPGEYTKCPFDSNAVMCDMEAQVGEIKFSLRTDDHDGWLLCDGRTLSDIDKGKYKNFPLATLLIQKGFKDEDNQAVLPYYLGRFLRIKGGKSASNYTTVQSPAIPEHSHKFPMYKGQIVSSRNKIGSIKGNNAQYNLIRNDSTPYESDCSTTAYSDVSIYDINNRVCSHSYNNYPAHYTAGIFIYVGKVGEKIPGA